MQQEILCLLIFQHRPVRGHWLQEQSQKMVLPPLLLVPLFKPMDGNVELSCYGGIKNEIGTYDFITLTVIAHYRRKKLGQALIIWGSSF